MTIKSRINFKNILNLIFILKNIKIFNLLKFFDFKFKRITYLNLNILNYLLMHSSSA